VTVAGATVVAPTAPTLTAPADLAQLPKEVGATVSATVTAGQVQINVRPGVASFTQKPLKEQIVSHRINIGDPETVARQASGC